MIVTDKRERPTCVEQMAHPVAAVITRRYGHRHRFVNLRSNPAQMFARTRDHGPTTFTATPIRRGDRPAHQEQP